MKTIPYIGIILILLLFPGLNSDAQDCKKFHLYGECNQYPGKFFKMEGQSRSNTIGVGDKLIYNVIFYGERKYKLFFCTSELFYPIHYTLKDASSNALLYDNSKDEFSETIELSIENTQKILIEITVLAQEADSEVLESYFGCLGFLVFWKPQSSS